LRAATPSTSALGVGPAAVASWVRSNVTGLALFAAQTSLLALSCACALALLSTLIRLRPAAKTVTAAAFANVMLPQPDLHVPARRPEPRSPAPAGGDVYRQIVEASADGIWVSETSTRTTFANPRLTELLGFTNAELLAAPMAAFLADETGAVARARCMLHDQGRDPISVEACFRRKDGSTLWTDVHIKPMHNADGTLRGVVAVIAEIADATERRRVRRVVAESDEQYRILAEAMPHPVFTARADGANDYCNRAWYEYSGLSEKESYGGGWVSIVHPYDAPHAVAQWQRSIATGSPFEVPLRVRRASDGMYRWHLSRATPARDASGAIVRWIGSIVDIHHFKLASETRSVLDTLGQIVAISSHDGNLEYMSPSWSQYTGNDIEKTCADADAMVRDSLHQDDHAIVEAQIRASNVMPFAVQQDEIRLRGADGTYRWFVLRTVALAETDGTPERRVNTFTDIDDFKQSQAAFGRSETRYRALTDALPQIVWIIDEQARLQYANERWSIYTGLAFDANAGQSVLSIVHPGDFTLGAPKRDVLRGKRDCECELRLRRHDGEYRWHLLRSVPLGAAQEAPTRWIVTATDIEARKTAEAVLAHSASELSHRAHHDPLTNLPNRTRLTDRLTQMIDDAKRETANVAVMYLDVDYFKSVNETLGHNAGDEFLVEVAARINSALRTGDIASRFGGDEFVLACAAAGPDDAVHIAERLQAAVGRPLQLHGKRIVVSCSIGISLFPYDGSVATDLIAKADLAMYDAKQNGRNAWGRYTSQTNVPAIAPLDFEAEVREAIALQQFVVYYQPIVSVETGRPVGAEALVRWQHPERGLLGPGEFISFAENHGLIAPIGEFVLHTACAELRRLKLRERDDFSISVNVSAHQFQKPGFVETIASAIRLHGIDPRRLDIEITESVVMSNTAAAVATLDRLQELDVKLSIDDFGTGYSSLAYIKNFPINTLKIDRSFVTDIARSFTDQAIAKTIVTLAHSLGMRVVAEGVETTEQLELLRSFGADCFQGFLVSRPLPPADFEQFFGGRRALSR
jgi:diguanylate cyclase (GGDEF)-like protein/PAS domain S-box-containing protein